MKIKLYYKNNRVVAREELDYDNTVEQEVDFTPEQLALASLTLGKKIVRTVVDPKDELLELDEKQLKGIAKTQSIKVPAKASKEDVVDLIIKNAE